MILNILVIYVVNTYLNNFFVLNKKIKLRVIQTNYFCIFFFFLYDEWIIDIIVNVFKFILEYIFLFIFKKYYIFLGTFYVAKTYFNIVTFKISVINVDSWTNDDQ